MTTTPDVGVVVATHNRAGLLPRLFAALQAQTDVTLELVVVDDASTDATAETLRALADRMPFRTVVRSQPVNNGPAAARNVGWRLTTADVVAFTDDDCVPQPRWLRALLDGMTDADLGQGVTIPDPAQADRFGPFSRTIDVRREDGLYRTCNVAYRRSLLDRVGGFDENFPYPAAEDTDLAWRCLAAGARTSFVADAVVHHDVRPSSFLAALRDTVRWESVVLATRQHPRLRDLFPSPVFWRASHPPALAAGVGLAVALAGGRHPLLRIAGAAATVPYLRFRLRDAPLPGGPRRRAAAIPAALLIDLTEVAVLASASVKYRTLLL